MQWGSQGEFDSLAHLIPWHISSSSTLLRIPNEVHMSTWEVGVLGEDLVTRIPLHMLAYDTLNA
jgi:hypothetical protein